MTPDDTPSSEVPDEEHRERSADDVPMTGDSSVDEALAQLAAADPDDLDAQIEAGERVHQTLRSRLSDLGG